MKREKQLYILLGFLMLLLSLPLLQQQLKVIDSGTLAGVVIADTSRPELSLKHWLNDSFQDGQNRYVEHNIGFRPDFIRLSNQLSYSLFKKTAACVVIGRHDNLYEYNHIDPYFGREYVGEAKIADQVRKLKFIQDTLDGLGKTLVFIYAPSKVQFMPEDLPASLDHEKKGPTNYAAYRRLCAAAGIREIDFNAWFLRERFKRKHPLFTKSSIHWTAYAGLIAMDSLQRFMKIHRGWDTPDISWDDNEQGVTGGPILSEDDLEKLLNLVVPMKPQDLFHPTIRYDEKNKKPKPRAIYIADSFMWIWMNLYLPHNINSSFQYWNYYTELYTPARPVLTHLTPAERIEEILAADWIIMMYSDCNLSKPGGAFINDTYDYFKGIKH